MPALDPGIWEQCPPICRCFPVWHCLLPLQTLLSSTAVDISYWKAVLLPHWHDPRRQYSAHPICRHPSRTDQAGPLSSATHPRPICGSRPPGTSFIFLAQGFWALRKPSSASLVSLKPPMICL